MKRATLQRKIYIVVCSISIHALVKRATYLPSNTGGLARDFNPRPREEGDARQSIRQFYTRYFNPRPREEGDQTLLLQLSEHSYFNPRPREEGDIMLDGSVVFIRISIHALVKRATEKRQEASVE